MVENNLLLKKKPGKNSFSSNLRSPSLLISTLLKNGKIIGGRYLKIYFLKNKKRKKPQFVISKGIISTVDKHKVKRRVGEIVANKKTPNDLIFLVFIKKEALYTRFKDLDFEYETLHSQLVSWEPNHPGWVGDKSVL
jgi:ribonuclease P protein component